MSEKSMKSAQVCNYNYLLIKIYNTIYVQLNFFCLTVNADPEFSFYFHRLRRKFHIVPLNRNGFPNAVYINTNKSKRNF